MRNELNQIERVELYLNGELNIADQAAFENQMATDPQLTELVAAQQLVQQAALRKAIRADVLKYGAGGGFFSKWWMTILGAGLVALLLGSVYLYNMNTKNSTQNETVSTKNNSVDSSKVNMDRVEPVIAIETILDSVLKAEQDSAVVMESETLITKSDKTKESYSYEEDTHCDGLKTWAKPDSQIFDVVAEEGATIEGKDGTLIIVPENAFVDPNGKVITGKVEVELVEALQMSEMVAYNLTTMNGDKALQSGGMIYVQPRVNGKEVNISQTNPLYIEIPNDNYNADMMAWEGEVDANGDIDWTNPKPLEKYLTKVDFENLDFLPNGFESAVSAGMPFKSYTKTTDALVDSLYYSLGMDNLISEQLEILELDTIDEAFTKMQVSPETGNSDRRGSMKEFLYGMKYLFRRNYIHGRGVVTGYVLDEDGKRAGGSRVTIVQNERSNRKTIIANKHGKFTIDKIEEGPFMLTAYNSSSAPTANGILMDSVAKMKKGDTIRIKQPIVLATIGNSFGRKGGKSEQQIMIGGRPFKPIDSVSKTCFINPLSIKTIRAVDFENTFIATLEFQERIKLLHGLENAQELFDLYLNNLSKDLWEVDQMVANKLKGDEKAVFQKLADQKLTNVENDGIYQEQLSAYYNSKLKNYKSELKVQKIKYAKTSTEQLRIEQAKLNDIITNYNNIAFEIDGKNQSNNVERLVAAPKEGSSNNISYVMLSASKISRNVVSSRNSYAIPWAQSGWMNIDAYLHELSKGSHSVDIKDNDSGESKSGRTKVYQCLNALKTIVPLTVSGWVAKAKFPKENSSMGRQMKSTYCIGIKREQGKTYFAHQKFNPYKLNEVELSWEEINPNDLKAKLEKLPGFDDRIIKDVTRANKQIGEEIKGVARRTELKKQQESIFNELDAQKDIVAKEQAKLDAENCFIESLKEVVDKCGIGTSGGPVYRYKVKVNVK